MREIPTAANSPSISPLLQRGAQAAGGACLTLGCVVLIGWHAHILPLLRIHPGWVAMAYNTALGFSLAGAGLLLRTASNKRRAASLCAGLCLLISLLTLGEYAANRSFGIDELIMKAYTRAGIVNSARMAFCTALCFALSGAALLLKRPALMATFGACIVGLGCVALSGYLVGIASFYAWGAFTRMAVHTASGFIVLGFGLTMLAWRDSVTNAPASPFAPRWLSVVIGLGAATAALCLWQALIVAQSEQAALLRRLLPGSRSTIEPILWTYRMIPAGMLLGGLVMAGLLAWITTLAQTARRQAVALQIARDHLEERVAARTAELAKANRAVRDVLESVTEGKLRLCETTEQLPPILMPSDASSAIHLTPSEGLSALRHQVRELAARASFPPERSQDLETAVGEAAMNAVVHAQDGEGRIYADDHGTIQVWVSDRGPGIVMEHLPRATLERGYTTAGTLGHGFWLMLNMVDRVWLLTGVEGTTVVLEQNPAPPALRWAGERNERAA